ncbi:MAG: hypothetical protein EB082_10485 [Verrucomicrobia bacterium]|nr:hypothetical protein [Verrucomicrobiota bacterium]NBU09032.1 hypothetical protein [Pseudomonadota bacterium]NDD38816.1 hypothetical protein [Verrucomicrobiota bacterium]
MNLSRRSVFPALPTAEQAFTMVEVALSLAIVAFAMVAIIGVMPVGLNVRKENREDTIISQDATALIEAIRSGGGGSNLNTIAAALVQMTGPANALTGSNYTSADVISRLCIPRWDSVNAPSLVRAYFHAMSGTLGDVSGTNVSPVAFSYVVTSEVTNYTGLPANAALNRFLTNNLYEVKLTFQWPVYEPPAGQFPTNFGNGKLVMRTLVSGELVTNGSGGYLFRGANYYGQ